MPSSLFQCIFLCSHSSGCLITASHSYTHPSFSPFVGTTPNLKNASINLAIALITMCVSSPTLLDDKPESPLLSELWFHFRKFLFLYLFTKALLDLSFGSAMSLWVISSHYPFSLLDQTFVTYLSIHCDSQQSDMLQASLITYIFRPLK